MTSNINSRIERMAARMKISAEDFITFSTVKCLEDLEALDRLMADEGMRSQLRDLLDLRRVGRMPDADFAREIEELISMPADAGWEG